MHRLAAIKIPLAKGIHLLLAPASEPAPDSGLQSLDFLPDGWEGKRGSAASPLGYAPNAATNGMHPLAVVEVAAFHWELLIDASQKIKSSELTFCSSLSGSLARNQWNERRTSGRIHGDFRFTIYLGAAWFELLHQGQPIGRRLFFEVITEKIDYAQEYRAMVESIGNRCSQLLLDWGAPTALNISANPEKRSQTLLEQFLFLRHVLGPNRLDLYLETLSHRPHSTLNRERVWQPAAFASPTAFARDPLRFGRQWEDAGNGGGVIAGFSPQEILTERKFDSFDTPPNRFVKFALQTFRGICEDVVNSRIANPDTGRVMVLNRERGAAWQEAVQMRDTLDACLAAPIFREVGRLSRIPFESQALQKREGYREILHAWLMLDAAAQIDWPGRNDAYDGTNRDVATLYEFWLYFVLIDLFQNKLGMTWLRGEEVTDSGPLPFCCRPSKGGMLINLKRGSESYCRFSWEHAGQRLLVHFFYNRQFSEQSGILEDGSYSKSFRPDYTVVILPAEYEAKGWRKAEELAEGAGTISYLHFDAKYRIDRLKDLFGATEETDADRQEAKSTGTVKNADLYKMHTYNEAIRRTVGSFVLYPGSDARPNYQDSGSDRNIYRRYHEIIPGIGAFALKPKANNGNHEAHGVESLRQFFLDFLTHQASKFTQSHRINYWTHNTIKDKPVRHVGSQDSTPDGETPPIDVPIAVGFIRAEAQTACRERGLFYFHAIEADGQPTSFDQAVLQAKLFVPHGKKQWLGWYAPITSCRLASQSDLMKTLAQYDHMIEGNTPFYFLMEFSPDSVLEFKNSPTMAVPLAGAPKFKKWTYLFPPVESVQSDVSHGT